VTMTKFEVYTVTDTTVEMFIGASTDDSARAIAHTDLAPNTLYNISDDGSVRPIADRSRRRHDVDQFVGRVRGAQQTFWTMPAPKGALLHSIATVNDVHFGKTGADRHYLPYLGEVPVPVFSGPAEGLGPTVSRGAIDAIRALRSGADPDLVVVKGDLTERGTHEEYQQYRAMYDSSFNKATLLDVRGNHDARPAQWLGAGPFADNPVQSRELDHIVVILVDTSVNNRWGGDINADQFAEIREICASTDKPVLLMGHHPVGMELADHWVEPRRRHLTFHPESAWGRRVMHTIEDKLGPYYPDRLELARKTLEALPTTFVDRRILLDSFVLNPVANKYMLELLRDYPSIVGYWAGHTHRNRRRRVADVSDKYPTIADVPLIENQSTVEFPCGWTEINVYQHEVRNIAHRVSTPEALAWAEQSRTTIRGLIEAVTPGRLDERCFAIPT
jgi:Icc protein